MWCRLRNREQYQDFLKCLNLFAQEIVAKQELQIMVQDILGRYPDLLVSPACILPLEQISGLCIRSEKRNGGLDLLSTISAGMMQTVWVSQ